MLVNENRCHADDRRPELQYQKREYEESEKPAEKDGEYKVCEFHFEGCGRQREQLERKGRRHHRGKHQGPELMAVEGRSYLVKLGFRNPLCQQGFTAFVPNDIKENAARGRAGGRHHRIKQKARRFLVDIGGNYRIKRYSEKGRVNGCNGKHCPGSERRKQRPYQTRVSQEDVLECSHPAALSRLRR